MIELEETRCPLCACHSSKLWGRENGYSMVKCRDCGLVYLNPRPTEASLRQARASGLHQTQGGTLDASHVRSAGKIRAYQRILARLIASERPVRWLDIGAGYGELLEAAQAVMPDHSSFLGTEPMQQKTQFCRSLGLSVTSQPLSSVKGTFDVITMFDVFSHLTDFREVLRDCRRLLSEDGKLLMKTGNGAELASARDYPGPLELPDHMVFAGRSQLSAFFQEAGFNVQRIEEERIDTLLRVMKEIRRAVIGKPTRPVFPYSSAFRVLYVLASPQTPE